MDDFFLHNATLSSTSPGQCLWKVSETCELIRLELSKLSFSTMTMLSVESLLVIAEIWFAWESSWA